MLRLAREPGAPRVGRVALDLSKVETNASKHKAMSYRRMRDNQQQRESRLKRIREAKRVLEARATDAAAAKGQPAKSAKPDAKAQYNFTDPESRIMKGPDGFVQAKAE